LDGAADPRPIPNFDDRPGTQLPAEPETPPATTPLVTDFCDDSTYPNGTWLSHTSQHFTLQYLAGTAAEKDRQAIAARLENAYSDIRAQLGIAAEPGFTVNLSPSRSAALAHGRGFGRGWADQDRYDVIYTGAPDSFEVMRHGHLLTMMLDYHVDATNRSRVALLATGVAEYLDQSGRDLHGAYALQLEAGIESRVRIAEFDARDVNGRNPGRAGSLVQFLVERYGMETFGDIYRATTVTWTGSCYGNPTYGCISTPEQLTAMLDGVLSTYTGAGWLSVQPAWQAAIEDALARDLYAMGTTATAEIENVLRVQDEAVAANDANKYRSTLEGFYCDFGGEALRATISDRAVSAFGSRTSKLLALHDTGTKNFWTAQALVQRTDDRGATTFGTVMLEHLPVGWRVTYGPDWY
jgi:hypothetical protein